MAASSSSSAVASAKPIPVGSRVVDSLPFSRGGDAAGAARLKAAGVEAVALYIGAAGPQRVADCLAAGLGVFAVTFGSRSARQDPASAIATAKAWGLSAGTSIFLDVEGAGTMSDPTLLGDINAWGDAVAAAGYLPGIYVAPPQPMTSDELYHLRVVRYWKGGGSIRDRNGQLAEPTGCGWCMTQMWPSQMCAGYLVDWNIVGEDFKGRLPAAAYL